MSEGMRNRSLLYVLQPTRIQPKPITLDLFEAESYAAAVVVQQLVGTLVYYSNQGRYEPRIAESWKRNSPHLWSFKIRRGIVCENGEKITPQSFKQSLERSIKYLGSKRNLPVFNRLIGYREFISGSEQLNGIVAHDNELDFEFSDSVRTGLIEFLSFAPFGYICSENLNESGAWKNPKKFISSGPYKIEDLEIGVHYKLRKRNDWFSFSLAAPERVDVVHSLSRIDSSSVSIIDTSGALSGLDERFQSFELVPEYLNAVLLGNFEAGFFASLKNRNIFRASIEEAKNIFPKEWNGYVSSATFFSSQNKPTRESHPFKAGHANPHAPLIIEGKEPTTGITGTYTWPILRTALDQLGWKYVFAGNQPTWSEVTSSKYDIRMRSPSIGGGFEAWGISSLFCSSLGSGLPDPTRSICRMAAAFEQDQLSEEQFQTKFLNQVEDDSAVLPIAHFGLKWYLTPEIERSSLSPLISVIRFDQIELKAK